MTKGGYFLFQSKKNCLVAVPGCRTWLPRLVAALGCHAWAETQCLASLQIYSYLCALMKTILLTGAGGFIGKRFIEASKGHYELRPVSVRFGQPLEIDWQSIDVVVHLAGKAHSMVPIEADIYYQSNRDLTIELAKAAKIAGVPHFVFMSTVNVYKTEASEGIINENSDRTPQTPYGDSKRQAEDALLAMADDTFTVSVVRPPLVYGPGVKGNLLNLLNLAQKPWPLPLGGINNKRSMVHVGNLVAMTHTIVDQKAGGCYLATDGRDISTSYLLSQIRINMGRKPGLIPFPSLFIWLLKTVKPTVARRLFGSFELDASSSFTRLGFKPPFTIEAGLKEMVDSHLNTNKI
jgi:nucleoside-diphosphate-sugar epimerase